MGNLTNIEFDEIDSILYIHTGFIIVSLSLNGYEICSVNS